MHSRYLSTLDKYIEPLYVGTPLEIIDALPGLLNNIRMMHTIARYYATPAQMVRVPRPPPLPCPLTPSRPWATPHPPHLPPL